MNQNVYGMFLFCAIVGAAIFVGTFYVAMPEATIIEAPSVYSKTIFVEKDRTCFKDYKSKKPKKLKFEVVQTVLNAKTKQLTTQLKWNDLDFDSTQAKTPLAFHFFQKTSKGFEYLGSEQTFLPLEIDSDSQTSEIISSYNWLDKRSNLNNLYLMVENYYRPDSNNIEEVSFDELKAQPILLDLGKN